MIKRSYPARCKKCGHQMGEYVKKHGKVYWLYKGVTVLIGNTYCGFCGQGFRFKSPPMEFQDWVEQQEKAAEIAV